MNIIIIEKRDSAGRFLEGALASEGFGVERTDSAAAVTAPVVVMLVAPEADQAVVDEVSLVRTRQPNAFVMVTTDCDSLPQRLACYEAGADDCLFKPFRFEELVAKLKTFERRRARYAEIALLRAGNAMLDPVTLELRVDDRVRGLTKREAELLAFLARADGEAVKREDVLRDAWDAPHWMTSNSVDVYVGYARRKLQLLMSDVSIAAVRGVGFKLVKLAESGR